MKFQVYLVPLRYKLLSSRVIAYGRPKPATVSAQVLLVCFDLSKLR